jgi:hypothetical protein
MKAIASRILLSVFLFSGFVACSDYNFTKDAGVDPCVNDAPCIEDTGRPKDTQVPLPEEICNGIDDNGDGQIDEGFPDTDEDGIADCMDDACELETLPAGSVTVDAACLAPDIQIADPWDVAIEWQYTVTGGSGVIVMPAIGNLTDDNGDGVVDDQDNPDIVFTTWSQNHLVALHGDGSGVIFQLPGFNGNAGVAIADVDSDGQPEIIAGSTTGQIVAVDVAGKVEWVSEKFPFQAYPQPTVADLEGDGDIEVIFDIAIVEGSDGSTVTTLAGVTSNWRAPVVADVDNDGIQEILLGEHCYSPTGVIEFSVPRVSDSDSVFAAVADIDGDPGGESFWVTGSKMYIVDDNGSILKTVQLNAASNRPGPPAVADFDGDGQVEIAVPASQQLEVWEIDGTRKWGVTIQDNSGIAGVSGYDINADGVYEVLYTDEVRLRIFDGKTGAVLYENTNHSSATLWEYPVIADVDGDGSAEIVIASNGSIWRGITVLGHNGDGWAKSGATWPVHDFAMTNVEPDGHVPTPAPKSWDVYNVFRARPTVDDAAVDLIATVVDACFSGCEEDSPASLSVQVANQGGVDSSAGIPVSLYALNGTVETLLGTQTLTAVLPAGESVDTLVFEFTKGDFGSDGVIVRVDDDGTGTATGVQTECDETNNWAAYGDWPC